MKPPLAKPVTLNRTDLLERRNGYVKLGGLGRYKVHTRRKSWQEALKACEQEGAYLVVLNSDKEARNVGSLTEKKGTAVYAHWIGFHSLHTGGGFITVLSKHSIINTACFACLSHEGGLKSPRNHLKKFLIKMLKRKEECNTYLIYVCRHRWSTGNPVKR
jgi:Lectin C-type domain.